MQPQRVNSAIDHYLVARAQSRVNGANAHEVHALLGRYFGLTALAEEDPVCAQRAQRIEQRLRAFCQTGRIPGCEQ